MQNRSKFEVKKTIKGRVKEEVEVNKKVGVTPHEVKKEGVAKISSGSEDNVKPFPAGSITIPPSPNNNENN